MLAQNVAELSRRLPADALVLDVGGWGRPLARADWVLDAQPYRTRGLYGFDGEGPERYDESRWVQWDICERRPFPFPDKRFDFVVCSHTLEDVRDPVWVGQELVRVGHAGYVEVPSRLEEQAFGVQGPWVGWGHHHWLVDVDPARSDVWFTFKHHIVHGKPGAAFPAGFADRLTPAERVQWLWWDGSFTARERRFDEPQQLDDYLTSFVTTESRRRDLPVGHKDGPRRLRRTRGRRAS